MSQYGYRLNVHGGDHKAIQRAFRLYAERCEAEAKAGNEDPFASDLMKMHNLLHETEELDREAYREFEAEMASGAAKW